MNITPDIYIAFNKDFEPFGPDMAPVGMAGYFAVVVAEFLSTRFQNTA